MAFEARAKNLVLSIGELTSHVAQHPNGDLHTVQFVVWLLRIVAAHRGGASWHRSGETQH